MRQSRSHPPPQPQPEEPDKPRSPQRLGADAPRIRANAISACVCYAVCSVLLSLTNKAIFSDAAFDFPFSVLASQALGTLLLLHVGSALRISSRVVLEPALLRTMAPITLLFAAMLGTSSRALRYSSVPVVTIFKNLAVVSVCLYEWRVDRQPLTPGVLLSLALMLGGSVVAAYGDLHFSTLALRWLLLNVVCTVSHIVAIRTWLASRASSTSKTYHNQLVALALFSAVAAACGEWPSFLWRLREQSGLFQLGFATSIVLGLLINVASFWCLSICSGTTYSFVGAANKIPTALLGHLFFSSGLTAFGWAGIVVGLAAGLSYAVSTVSGGSTGPAAPTRTAPLEAPSNGSGGGHREERSSKDSV